MRNQNTKFYRRTATIKTTWTIIANVPAYVCITTLHRCIYKNRQYNIYERFVSNPNLVVINNLYKNLYDQDKRKNRINNIGHISVIKHVTSHARGQPVSTAPTTGRSVGIFADLTQNLLKG